MTTLREELEAAFLLETTEKQDAAMMEIAARYSTPEDKKIMEEFVTYHVGLLKKDVEEIGNQLKRIEVKQQLQSVVDLLPLSYIAKNYFNKSSAWLYQCLNRNVVKGKVQEFKPEEIETLNYALQDISKKIGSVKLC